jgi:hypothetical protein
MPCQLKTETWKVGWASARGIQAGGKDDRDVIDIKGLSQLRGFCFILYLFITGYLSNYLISPTDIR